MALRRPKQSSRQSVSPLAPEVVVNTNTRPNNRRFSSFFIKAAAILTASLTLACVLPTVTNAAPAPTTFLCTTGSYTVSWDGVVASGSTCSGAVTIDASATSIGTQAFRWAPIVSVTLPSSVLSIGFQAFYGATSLTSVILPSTVTSIGLFAFSFTGALTTYIYCGSADLTNTGLVGKNRTCAYAPDAPTIGTATSTGTTTATVSFTAPVSDGGSTILSYTATSSPGSITATLTQAGSGTISITGLSATTAYTFTVVAHNAIGDSLASSASNSVTTSTPTTVPDAPTIGTATSTGTTTATVAFTAPVSDGGSTILSYTATSSPGSISSIRLTISFA